MRTHLAMPRRILRTLLRRQLRQDFHRRIQEPASARRAETEDIPLIHMPAPPAAHRILRQRLLQDLMTRRTSIPALPHPMPTVRTLCKMRPRRLPAPRLRRLRRLRKRRVRDPRPRDPHRRPDTILSERDMRPAPPDRRRDPALPDIQRHPRHDLDPPLKTKTHFFCLLSPVVSRIRQKPCRFVSFIRQYSTVSVSSARRFYKLILTKQPVFVILPVFLSAP